MPQACWYLAPGYEGIAEKLRRQKKGMAMGRVLYLLAPVLVTLYTAVWCPGEYCDETTDVEYERLALECCTSAAPLTQTLHSAVKNGTVTLAFLDTRLDVFTLGVGPKHS